MNDGGGMLEVALFMFILVTVVPVGYVLFLAARDIYRWAQKTRKHPIETQEAKKEEKVKKE
jgi:hypothetical protein